MCLYPVYGKNKRFLPSKKNGGNPPICQDKRLLIVPYKCGKCYECRKQKQREWMVRLSEELRHEFAYFVTLTFSPKAFSDLYTQTSLWWEKNPNEIASKAVRFFLERVRKETGKSIRHWFVTELGEDKDRLHIHGIVFGQKSAALCREKWNYGKVDIGTYCNEKTINYITKYILKVDVKHKTYTPIILCTKGIGSQYIKRKENGWQKQNYKNICVPTYKFRNGTKMAMPQYYKNKLFTDKEREIMWLNNLERGYEWIGGEKVKADDLELINNLRQYYRKLGRKIFFDNPDEWDEQKQRRKEEKQREYIAKYRRKIRHANT